jgi:ABC-type polysaccharide/polyol phosphate export permease
LFSNLSQLVRYRGLIWSLVARELKARYRGSVLGFLWSFINPLLLLAIYSFVFSTILPNRSSDLQPYALFLLCGLLPWNWFSTSLNEAAASLMAGGNLIKKVLFPAEVLPIVSVVANMLHFFLALPIVIGVLLAYRQWPDPVGLGWFPLVVLIQLIFTIGLALPLAALTVHFRDIRDILSNLLTVWFFVTPIIYPWQEAPEAIKRFLNLNPFMHLAVSYQEILFFEGPFGHLRWLLLLGAISVVFFLFGYFVFDRLRDTFAEEV